jgi:hypothetical protein
MTELKTLRQSVLEVLITKVHFTDEEEIFSTAPGLSC